MNNPPAEIHIAMVVRIFSPYGGLELYTYRLVEGLLAHGLRVTVFCERNESAISHDKLKIIPLANTDKYFGKSLALISQWQTSRQEIDKHGPFDIIHTQHYPVRRADVATFHNHTVKQLTKVGFNWESLVNRLKSIFVPAYLLRNHIDRQMTRQAKCLAFPSIVTRTDFYETYFADGEHVTPAVIANPGADPPDPLQANQPRTEDDTFKFLFVGRGYRSKGVDVLLSACQLLKKRGTKFHLSIVGLKKHWLKDFALKIRGLDKNVEYLGFHKNMPSLFVQSQVIVAPSRKEVFGMAVLQAMNYGVVPIAGHNTGVAELMSDGYDSLIIDDHLSAENTALLMQKLVDDKDLREKLSRNARLTAAKAGWDKTVAATIEAYKMALSRSKAAHAITGSMKNG